MASSSYERYALWLLPVKKTFTLQHEHIDDKFGDTYACAIIRNTVIMFDETNIMIFMTINITIPTSKSGEIGQSSANCQYKLVNNSLILYSYFYI